MAKFWIASAVAVALAVAGWEGYGRWQAEAEAPPPATVPVARGTVSRTVLATGVLQAERLLSVGARVSGQVELLAVGVGADVRAGDLIARIDSLEQQNEVLRAKADLDQIEAQIAAKVATIDDTERQLDRKRQLTSKQLALVEELEATESALAVARAELVGLKAQRDRARVNVDSSELALARTQIAAPIAGTIVAVVTEAGQTVNAASNTPTIVKIAALDRMVVKADISEADVVRVRPGQKVTFTLIGDPEQRYDAELLAVEPAPASIRDSDTVDSDKAVYYQGLFEVDNSDRMFRIGMTAEVSILVDEAADVLVVPTSAIDRGPGGAAVTVFDPASGAIARRPVEIGLTNSVSTEIVSGVAEGEEVVTDRDSLTRAATYQPRRRSFLGF